MLAHVYKSLRKADAYVYLAKRDGFDVMPGPVRAQLEPLKHVLEVDLSTVTRLALVDVEQVRSLLATRGFYLQVPQTHVLDPMTEDHGTDA